MEQTTKKSFIVRDHRYVCLGGSVLALLGLSMYNCAPNPYSFIAAGSVLGIVAAAVCWAFLALSAAALVIKWTHWKTYDATVMKRPGVMLLCRYLSYAVCTACILFALDRVLLNLVYLVRYYAGADSNPQSFFGGLVYMASRNSGTFATGVWTTVRLALFGTAIAFVLSIFMVFMRIQTPDKRDNDLVKLLKIIANKFASLYIFIIRGTPMMVQSLIFYYAIFNLFKRTDMSIMEINRIWSFFISGLVTISLNSTAYLAEVLRGGIMAIDAGQMEAARSLGMTQWQAMRKVIFPQAVKNSIPAIGNEFIINIKDSSVLSVLGVSDLMFQTKGVVGIYYRDLEMYVLAAALYLILTYLSSLLLKAISKKLETSDNAAQKKSADANGAMPDYGIPSSN